MRILLVSDRALSRCGLRMALHTQVDLKVVAEAQNLDEALDSTSLHRPDVVILDTVHPCRQASRAVTSLVKENAEAAILVVAHQLCRCTHYVFNAGASGLLLNHVGPEELAAAVRTVASGHVVIPASMARQLRTTRCRSRADSAKLRLLSARELEVLRLIVMGRSNASIAAQLHLSEGTVKSHVQHVLCKLGLPDRVHAVIFAYETGFVGGEPQSAEDHPRSFTAACSGR